MNGEYAIVNGEFVSQQAASILVTDLSLQRGYGIFDFFRTINCRPVFLDEHLDRLYYSATQLRLSIQQDKDHLKGMIYELIEKNNLPHSGIRITITGGYSPDGYSISRPNVLVAQTPFRFDAQSFEKGARLMTHNYQRQLPSVKTIDYLQAIFLQPLLKEKHADDILYHHNGVITECPRANFFIVTHQDEVITPAEHVLKGITRKKILRLEDLVIREGEITLKDLGGIKEAFITSTTKNVLPVLKIDDMEIGDGKPGAITTHIYQKICELKGEGY